MLPLKAVEFNGVDPTGFFLKIKVSWFYWICSRLLIYWSQFFFFEKKRIPLLWKNSLKVEKYFAEKFIFWGLRYFSRSIFFYFAFFLLFYSLGSRKMLTGQLHELVIEELMDYVTWSSQFIASRFKRLRYYTYLRFVKIFQFFWFLLFFFVTCNLFSPLKATIQFIVL